MDDASDAGIHLLDGGESRQKNHAEPPCPRSGDRGDVILNRIGALVLDAFILGAIVGVVFAPVMVAMGSLDSSGETFGVVAIVVAFLIGLVVFVYVFLLEGLWGYTPGKRLVGLVVVKEDGSQCTIGASIVRNLLRIVDQLPTLYLLGMVAILVSDRSQRIGDLAASTVVVKSR